MFHPEILTTFGSEQRSTARIHFASFSQASSAWFVSCLVETKGCTEVCREPCYLHVNVTSVSDTRAGLPESTVGMSYIGISM
jgi:hypothetical protein